MVRALLKPSIGAHVVEVAQMVIDADVIEHALQCSKGYRHAVGSAESAKLSAPFQVRLQVENHAWNATSLQAAL